MSDGLSQTQLDENPVQVWDVVVQPDRVWARTAEEARAIFVKAIADDPELMYVSVATEEIDVD